MPASLVVYLANIVRWSPETGPEKGLKKREIDKWLLETKDSVINMCLAPSCRFANLLLRVRRRPVRDPLS